MKTVAIIGIGKWGKNLISQFSKICKIKYCYSKGDKSNILWLINNYPMINFCNNLDTILDDPSVDAVIIATPIITHYNLVMKALISKKHVFVEKPITTTVTKANKLLKIAKNNNLSLFVGSIFLYHPILKKLKIILQKEKIQSLYLNWEKLGAFNEKLSFDLLTHYIIIVNELVGIPKKIFVQKRIGIITDCDVLSLQMKFKKNLDCFIDINRVSSMKHREIIIKTSKNLYLWENEILFKFNKKKYSYQQFFAPKTIPLENECKEFLKHIKSTKKNYVNTQKSIDAIHIINKYIK